MVSGRCFLILVIIVLFEKILEIYACLEFCLLNMESQTSDLKTFCQRVGKCLSILLINGVNYLP